MLAPTRHRLGWATLALASAAPLLVAGALTPAASGIGTHMQLGLPPCGFLALFALPCPACGLTTAFAHLAHGGLDASLAAHPLGLPLFMALTLLALRGLFESVRRRPASSLRVGQAEARCAWAYTTALLAVWLMRLLALASS